MSSVKTLDQRIKQGLNFSYMLREKRASQQKPQSEPSIQVTSDKNTIRQDVYDTIPVKRKRSRGESDSRSRSNEKQAVARTSENATYVATVDQTHFTTKQLSSIENEPMEIKDELNLDSIPVENSKQSRNTHQKKD